MQYNIREILSFRSGASEVQDTLTVEDVISKLSQKVGNRFSSEAVSNPRRNESIIKHFSNENETCAIGIHTFLKLELMVKRKGIRGEKKVKLVIITNVFKAQATAVT